MNFKISFVGIFSDLFNSLSIVCAFLGSSNHRQSASFSTTGGAADADAAAKNNSKANKGLMAFESVIPAAVSSDAGYILAPSASKTVLVCVSAASQFEIIS